MQELAYAQKIVLALGTATLDWDTIARLLDHGHIPDVYHGPFGHEASGYTINDTFRTVQTIEHQREAVKKRGTPGHESRFIDVLARFRETNATDPRDKIYGLLGLASGGLDVCVDYKKSVPEVYVDFFQTFVNTTKDLDLICQNPWGVPTAEARRRGLPSWCPDFSEGGEETLLFAQRSIFSAGERTAKSRVPSQTEHISSWMELAWVIFLKHYSLKHQKIMRNMGCSCCLPPLTSFVNHALQSCRTNLGLVQPYTRQQGSLCLTHTGVR
jgi:hypothetical protein